MNQAQKSAIKYIMSQPGWSVMLEYMDKVVVNWNEEPVKADTEFETVWRTAQREAKGQALRGFFNSLEEQILK